MFMKRVFIAILFSITMLLMTACTKNSDTTAETATAIDENKALDLLEDTLSDWMQEGTSIVSNGTDFINGEHSWIFVFGEDTEEKFTALEHFAVTEKGDIYFLDIMENKYLPYPDEYDGFDYTKRDWMNSQIY